MTVTKPSIWGTAKTLWSVRLVLKHAGLALAVFLLSLVWIRLPDASVMDVIGTALLAVLIVLIAGAGESGMILRLCGKARDPRRLLVGTAVLLVGIAMWLGWSAWIDHLTGGNDQLGGYLNSRLPHGMRNFFSYPHIVTCLSWVETAAVWIGAGALGLAVVAVTASARPLRAMAVGFRSMSYWVVVIVGATGAAILTTSLLRWVPGRTLRVEMMSLIARLAVVILVDVSVAALVLAISAACVRRSDAAYETPVGTPDASQERTAEIP